MPRTSRNSRSFEDGKNDGSTGDWADNRRWKEDADYRWGHEEGQKERKAENERQEREHDKEEARLDRVNSFSYSESNSVQNSPSTPVGTGLSMGQRVGSILIALLFGMFGWEAFQYGASWGLIFVVLALVAIGLAIFGRKA